MKRKIAAIVAALSLFAVVPSFAETKATDKRNAFEFCYLFQSRLLEEERSYKVTEEEAGRLFDFRNGIDYYDNQLNGKQYYADIIAGTAIVSVPDSNIDSLEIELMNSADTDDDQVKSTTRAIIALSALERGGTEAYLRSMANLTSPCDEAYSILKEITNHIPSAISREGNQVLAYSGNYDYYLEYWFNKERNIDLLYLIAKAR